MFGTFFLTKSTIFVSLFLVHDTIKVQLPVPGTNCTRFVIAVPGTYVEYATRAVISVPTLSMSHSPFQQLKKYEPQKKTLERAIVMANFETYKINYFFKT